MKNLCKFGVGTTRPKICSESGFGEVLGFVWDGFGTLWAVFWALSGALGVIFGHSKSFLFRALAQDGLQEASGINLGSILEGFGEGFGRFGRSLGSILARFWKCFGESCGRLRKVKKSRVVHTFVDRCAFRSPARSGLTALLADLYPFFSRVS